MSGPGRVSVLLVDDVPANLLALQAALEPLGEDLVLAASGEEALGLAEGTDFAAVLLDVRMPGLGGFETARLLRSRDRSRHTPVLFLTADEAELPVEEAYALGAVDYLLKPVSPTVLAAKVAAFVELHRLRAAERRRADDAVRENEAWLRTVTDSLPVLVGYIDREHRYGFANRGYEEWFGLGTGEAVGRHMSDVLGPDVYEQRKPYLEAALRGEATRFEGPTRHRDRGPLETDVTYTPHDVGGEVRGLFVLVQDVTERKRQEEAVRRSEARHKAVVETAIDGVVGMDRDGRIVEFNPAAERTFGLDREEVLGRDMADLVIPPEHRDAHREGLRRYLATGEARVLGRRIEVQALRIGGERFDCELSITRNPGEPPTFTAFLRDVAERKRAERRERFLAGLAAATQSLADPDEVTATAARMLAEHLGCDRCAYADVEDEAVMAITGDFARDVPSIVGRWPVAAFGREFTRLMLANEPYVVTDADADPRIGPDDLPAYRATTIRAVVSVPLHKGGRFTAGMAVHQKTPRRWTPEEVGLVREVVARCWEALERARSARAVRESEARLADVFRLAPSLMVVLRGPDHVFERVSDRYLELVGRRDVLGKPVRSALPELEGQGLFELLDGVYRTGEPFVGTNLPTRLRRRPGEPPEERFYDFVYQPLRGPDGSVAGIIGQGVDVTDRRRAEEDLREANRRKDEFLATLAHELRNPLAPIRSGLAVLRLAELGGDGGEVVETMERQAVHMVRLVDDLLDVSRVTTGRIALRTEPFDLREAVRTAVDAVRPSLEASRHEVEIRLPEGPLSLAGDRTRLAQIVSNLLDNACKYTPEGGRIELSVGREDGHAVIRVADTGIGLPAEMLSKVFDTFTQVAPTLDRSRGGLGVGLALVRRLVEMHGGTVAAESPGPDQGSTFTVRLPLAAVAGDAAEAPADDAADAPSGPGEDRRPPPVRRVLAVDDLKPAADLLSMTLRKLGQETRTAYDGPSALRLAEAFRPDVVISDIGMPGMDGYELARRIRAMGEFRPVLVALTGYGQEEDRRRAFAAGFDRHLVKPASLDVLHRLLAAVPAAGDAEGPVPPPDRPDGFDRNG